MTSTRTRFTASALSFLVLSGIHQGTFAQEITISKMEIRNDPPKQTHSRLRDIFWNTLKIEDRRTKADPKRALEDVWLESHLFPTRVPGLCRYDTLTIEFERVEGDYKTPKAQARAVGFRTASSFKFFAPPKDDYAEIVEYEGAIKNECSSKSGGDGFFSADSAEVATDGYISFIAMVELAKLGPQENLECDLFPTEKVTCNELVVTYSPDLIRSISKCEASGGEQCFEYLIDDREIQITSPFRFPERVQKVRLNSLIILTHPRVD